MRRSLDVVRHPLILQDARLVLARTLPRVSVGLSALLAAVVFLGMMLSIAMTVASGVLVGAVPEVLRGNGLNSPAGGRLLAAGAAVIAVFIATEVVGPVQAALIRALGWRLEFHLRERAIGATLAPAGIAHLEDPALADLVSRARSAGVGQFRPWMALQGLVDLVQLRLWTIVSFVLVAVFFHWWLALGLVVVFLAVRSRALHSLSKSMEAATRTTGDLRRSDYFLGLGLKPEAAKETRVFGLSDWVAARFRLSWLRAMERVWAERRAGTITTALWLIAVVFCAEVSAFAIVGRGAATGEIGLTALAIVTQAIVGLISGVFGFSHTETWLAHGATSVPAVLELESRTSQSQLGGDRSAAGLPEREIRFERMMFSYPGTHYPVFDGLDLAIPAGRSLAIVGENGAGKTTLIKLLARLYEPTGGQITVDGVSLSEIDAASWRRRLAVIFQDFARFELSAADNVGIGAVERLGERTALDRAASRAGAQAVIASLPNGWDTQLSSRYEGGADLSGGQWQRVALARALFAVEAGANVLVLDEPTASLDVRAEAEFFGHFLELTEGLTTILISHRFSSVRRADSICVLEGGQVVERGTHMELMAAGGSYARMYSLQAARFEDEPDVTGGTGSGQ